MYYSFFGLSRSPFSMTPDPKALFLTDSHREALAGLSYAVMQRKGFVVLEGQAGTGKTTLLRRLLQMLPQTEALTSMVVNPVLTAAEFLELLLMNFNVGDLPESKAQRLKCLEQLLQGARRDGKVPVLIIDEAHKLNNEVLEEIRLLTNYETDDCKLLQIVLTGQPELRDLLNRPDLWQLKQRVAVRLRIDPLSPDQVKQYIQYRWNRADATTPLPFSDGVVATIAARSKGIPRLINSICDNALLAAFADNTRMVSPQTLEEVVRDLDLGADQSGPRPVPVLKAAHIEKTAQVETTAPVEKTTPVGKAPVEKKPITPALAPRSGFEPLRLNTLERYMPKTKGRFFSFRRMRRPENLAPRIENA
jgi:general secretion pathway protein A